MKRYKQKYVIIIKRDKMKATDTNIAKYFGTTVPDIRKLEEKQR